MLCELKNLRKSHEDTNPFLRELSRYCVHTVSMNDFTTLVERAFTAAGFAVYCSVDLYELLGD